MIREMHLDPSPFEKIRTGRKDIELRVNDEKRRQFRAGDEIVCLERGTDRQFRVKIVALRLASTFAELFQTVDAARCGFDDSTMSTDQAAAVMRTFYAAEEERKYGVVGIELKVM